MLTPYSSPVHFISFFFCFLFYFFLQKDLIGGNTVANTISSVMSFSSNPFYSMAASGVQPNSLSQKVSSLMDISYSTPISEGGFSFEVLNGKVRCTTTSYESLPRNKRPMKQTSLSIPQLPFLRSFLKLLKKGITKFFYKYPSSSS